MQNDLGKAKVQATADLCQQLNCDLEVHSANGRFKRSLEIGNTLFVCVDSIETRRLIWNAVKDKVEFFCDGRMSTEVLRVVTVGDTASYSYYPSTLFTVAKAYIGPGTAKTTLYCANIAAGFMLAQFTKHLRHLPIDSDIQVNLLASEINVGDIYSCHLGVAVDQKGLSLSQFFHVSSH